MLRKLIPTACLALTALGLGAGCATKEPVIYGEAHLKRHALTFIDGFHYPTPFNPVPFDGLHADVDRIIYGLEAHPGESWTGHVAREGNVWINAFHRFHMDFDRIFLDMPEYPLETDY